MAEVGTDIQKAAALLRRGELDGLALAYRSPEREVFGHFSVAYLSLHYAVFYRTDSYRRLPGNPERDVDISGRPDR